MKTYSKIEFDLIQFSTEDVVMTSNLNAMLDTGAQATINFSQFETSSNEIVVSAKKDLTE